MAAGVDIITLATGEPDFDTPDHVIDAAIAALRNGQTRYTGTGGTPELRKAVVEKFRAKNFEPESYTLYSYAAVQIIKQAAEAANSLDPKKISETIKSGRKFPTVIGELSYDQKGDITRLDYVMYVWKKDTGGKITYVEIDQ